MCYVYLCITIQVCIHLLNEIGAIVFKMLIAQNLMYHKIKAICETDIRKPSRVSREQHLM